MLADLKRLSPNRKRTKNIDGSSCTTQIFIQSKALYSDSVPPSIPLALANTKSVTDIAYLKPGSFNRCVPHKLLVSKGNVSNTGEEIGR